MAQKTVLSLLALPTGPPRVFVPKAALNLSAMKALLTADPAFSCKLVVDAAIGGSVSVVPRLKVSNVSA